MRGAFVLVAAFGLWGTACAGSGVLTSGQRAAALESASIAWHPSTSADVPGLFVSGELGGALAAYLRKLVYLFEADGRYAGAALVDASPPRFEVLAGTWTWVAGQLVLDDGPPARLTVSDDGSLRLAGDDGVVILQKERAR